MHGTSPWTCGSGRSEDIGSERGIDWRRSDSLSLHEFLGVPLGEPTPDHSTISRTRRLIDRERMSDGRTHLAHKLEQAADRAGEPSPGAR